MLIKCKTLTMHGKIALHKAILDNKEELLKRTPQERKQFFNQWKELITDNSYTLMLRGRSALGSSYFITKHFNKSVNSAKEFNNDLQDQFTKMRSEIDTAMLKNGALKDVDFFTEVLQ